MKTETQIGAEAIKKLQDIVDRSRVAMMCTLNVISEIESRPMRTADCDAEGTLWFFSRRYSAKTEEIENDRNVCICYCNPSDNLYAAVHGTSALVDDRTRMDKLWTPEFKAWIPEGKDDAGLVMIKVKPYYAEYWDEKSSKMETLFRMAASVVKESGHDAGEYGELRFKAGPR